MNTKSRRVRAGTPTNACLREQGEEEDVWGGEDINHRRTLSWIPHPSLSHVITAPFNGAHRVISSPAESRMRGHIWDPLGSPPRSNMFARV